MEISVGLTFTTNSLLIYLLRLPEPGGGHAEIIMGQVFPEHAVPSLRRVGSRAPTSSARARIRPLPHRSLFYGRESVTAKFPFRSGSRSGRSDPEGRAVARPRALTAPAAARRPVAAACLAAAPGGMPMIGSRKIGKAKRTEGPFSFIHPFEHKGATLLLLVTILAKTFFPLVGSHLVTLMLLSVWHSFKI